jgi:uncharacterized membrane protein YkvI
MRTELATLLVLLVAVGGGVALKQFGLPFWAGLIWASVIGGIAYMLFRAKA